jgi:hypothetical protein
MTGIAMELPMLALEGVVRLLVVIELPEHPAIGGVTVVALFTETPVMGIVRGMAGQATALGIAVLRAQMTGLAGGDIVHADERKAGQVVIEKDLVVPCLCIVAGGAILTLPALVDIVRPMAIDALGGFEIGHVGTAMTGTADEIAMPAIEREFGVLGMIEIDRLPALRGVATLAVCPVATLVLVVFPMTGITRGLGLYPIGRLDMTGIAGGLLVPPGERILGIHVMPEAQFVPTLTGMAVVALLGIVAIVHIVDQMTGVTLLRGVLVAFIRMTEFAGQGLVGTDEFIVRIQVVIEQLALPVHLGMAGLTLFAELPAMGVVLFMTGIAVIRGITVFLLCSGMTTVAGQLPVAVT